MRRQALAAWRRWQRAAGPWQGWTQCPTLLSPAIDDIVLRGARGRRRAVQLASSLAAALQPGGVVCLLDLEPTLGVRVAAQLSRAQLAHPVLVLPRWPYTDSLLTSDSLLNALLEESHRLPNLNGRLENVAFVIDGERAHLVPDRSERDPRADNRHSLSILDLPNLATLRGRGIRRLIRITHGKA
jgi:hypothetical protein